AADARGDRGRPARAADRPFRGRPGRQAPVLRLGRPAATRPAVEGQRPLQRVLPRRERHRPRRRPPDRPGPARRRADPARARWEAADPGRAARAGAGGGAVVIRLGPQVCGTLEEAARREWLVADGVGGYSMGTVAGLRTRRYHGLLVVAVDGPGARM